MLCPKWYRAPSHRFLLCIWRITRFRRYSFSNWNNTRDPLKYVHTWMSTLNTGMCLLFDNLTKSRNKKTDSSPRLLFSFIYVIIIDILSFFPSSWNRRKTETYLWEWRRKKSANLLEHIEKERRKTGAKWLKVEEKENKNFKLNMWFPVNIYHEQSIQSLCHISELVLHEFLTG